MYAVGRARPSHAALLPQRPRAGSTCKQPLDLKVYVLQCEAVLDYSQMSPNINLHLQ